MMAEREEGERENVVGMCVMADRKFQPSGISEM
jgi:hypothetical protein